MTLNDNILAYHYHTMNSHRHSKCNQIIMDNLITLFHYKIELSTKIIGQFPIFPL